MNEILLSLHAAIIFFCTLQSLKMGKHALFTWICLQTLLANLFVLKQISLFGWQVTASDVFAVGSLLSLNLLQEYHGKELAKKALSACLYFLLLFALLSQLHLLYIPNEADQMHSIYEALLSQTPRLFLASFLSFAVVQVLDMRLFSWLKSLPLSLPLRLFLSLLTSQLLDTVLFTWIGLYGIVASCSDVILMSFLIKIVVICLLTPLTFLTKRYFPQGQLS